MSRRGRRKKSARRGADRSLPKAGPGAVYVEELVSARTGRERRLRNIAEHPLTLAHARGRITDDQFAAGEEIRFLCELRGVSGKDSTLLETGGGSGTRLPFTQSQLDAIRRLGDIRERLKERDWIMLEKFCGEGWSMPDAVRAATMCHPSGIVCRMQEALDELIDARRRRKRAREVCVEG